LEIILLINANFVKIWLKTFVGDRGEGVSNQDFAPSARKVRTAFLEFFVLQTQFKI
jgi:hypothetical protein